jgi:hypothetical protein
MAVGSKRVPSLASAADSRRAARLNGNTGGDHQRFQRHWARDSAAAFVNQARSYRELAAKCAEKLGLLAPSPSDDGRVPQFLGLEGNFLCQHDISLDKTQRTETPPHVRCRKRRGRPATKRGVVNQYASDSFGVALIPGIAGGLKPLICAAAMALKRGCKRAMTAWIDRAASRCSQDCMMAMTDAAFEPWEPERRLKPPSSIACATPEVLRSIHAE